MVWYGRAHELPRSVLHTPYWVLPPQYFAPPISILHPPTRHKFPQEKSAHFSISCAESHRGIRRNPLWSRSFDRPLDSFNFPASFLLFIRFVRAARPVIPGKLVVA